VTVHLSRLDETARMIGHTIDLVEKLRKNNGKCIVDNLFTVTQLALGLLLYAC